MSDLHDDPGTGPTAERVRSALQSTAAELTLDPIDPASVRHRATTRRRRRRIALGGGAAALALTLAGVVVANRDDGDDTIEFSEPTPTTQTSDPDGTASGTGEPTTTPTTTPATTPITTPPTLPPLDTGTGAASDTAEAASSPSGDVTNLLPWKNGFLRIGYRYEPQPLGPLPEEIAALFPDEVTALFPDGLPPTIDEATEVLTEAGLLDEVTAVLAEHPEASEAIYGGDPPPPTLEAGVTTDGATWSIVELTPPFDGPSQFLVDGDRLIAWSSDGWNPDPTPSSRELVVAWTDDLVGWQSTTVPIEVDVPASDYLHSDVYIGSVAVLGDQWLARVDRSVSTDFEALLPEDLADDLRYSAFGYGISTDDNGLRVDVEQADGPAVTHEFTWAELGLDGNPEPPTDDGRPQGSLLVGTFGGSFQELPVPDGQQYGTAFATDDEFLLIGDGVLASSNGVDWSTVDGLPPDEFVNGVVELRDGALFVTDGPGGPAGWIRHADGSFSRADLPELPGRYGLWNSSGTGAWIVDISDSIEFEGSWEPVTATVEYEGFTLSITDGPDGTAYSLLDAGGAVLREGTLDPEQRDDLIDVDPATGEYSVVIRDQAGGELVRIPGELLDAAVEEAGVGSTTTAAPAEEWTPDLWLIATADGVDWLTVDLDDPSPDEGFWTQAAAINDGSVLYQTVDGWVLAELPNGG